MPDECRQENSLPKLPRFWIKFLENHLEFQDSEFTGFAQGGFECFWYLTLKFGCDVFTSSWTDYKIPKKSTFYVSISIKRFRKRKEVATSDLAKCSRWSNDDEMRADQRRDYDMDQLHHSLIRRSSYEIESILFGRKTERNREIVDWWFEN